jgi:SAM-dependent methyltransferase
MNYSDITINDPNFIKRYLQKSRFTDAVSFFPTKLEGCSVLDFGGGDGELCLQLSSQCVNSTFTCYEPADEMYKQAQEKILQNERVSLLNTLVSVSPETIDVVYSLEVFEHLPEKESIEAINQIYTMLKPGGTLIIGVPNELFVAALYKGIFRLARRYGEFDASFKNILKCIFGCPPKNRPTGEISPGKQYHFHHVGFDHRVLAEKLKGIFSHSKVIFSPFRLICSGQL